VFSPSQKPKLWTVKKEKTEGTSSAMFGVLTAAINTGNSSDVPTEFAAELKKENAFFIYEKYAIFLIVLKSDLYLLPSLPLAIPKH